jgi:YidC/Oxa1 family membrane protein insertase
MTNIFGVPVDAVYHLVSGLTGFLTPVLGGVAAVAAIILLTVAVRAVLVPLSFRAMRGQAVQARLAPQLQALRTRYAKQPERLQREMTALYKREGTSLFAGITPLLLQWPLLSVVYILFRSPLVAGKPNVLLSHDLLGVSLGMHWLSGAGAASLQGLVFLGVFAALAALVWLSARLGRLMTAAQAAVAPAPAPAPGKGGGSARRASAQLTSGTAGGSGKRAAGQGTSGTAGGSGKRAAGQGTSGGAGGSGKPAGSGGAVPAGTPGWLVRVLPYLTVAFAAFVPLAAGVYLVTSVAWSLGERAFFWRSHGGPDRSAAT